MPIPAFLPSYVTGRSQSRPYRLHIIMEPTAARNSDRDESGACSRVEEDKTLGVQGRTIWGAALLLLLKINIYL